MNISTSSLLAILLGLGVFCIIVAIGWRSVQHRRILRMKDADGHETIIVAREDDEVSSVVTDTAEVHIADGVVRPFARVSNTNGRGITQLVTVDLQDLNLGQLAQSAEIDGQNVTGKVGGSVHVYGVAKTLGTLSASANIKLSESQIADFKPMQVLYATMGSHPGEARGEGLLQFRLEQGVLTLTNASYYNPPVDVRAYGTIREVDQMPISPIDLTLIGSLNLFKESKISLFKDLGDTVAAFQETGTTIRATGTLGKIQAAPALLSEVGENVQKILLGGSEGGE